VRIASVGDAAAAARGRRIDLGWSQRDVADRVGVSRRWVYQFEGGKMRAELGLVLRLFDALGIRLDAERPGYDESPDDAAIDLGAHLNRLGR
jgi:HTH-type transcriptional regulator/antitoxin HipB